MQVRAQMNSLGILDEVCRTYEKALESREVALGQIRIGSKKIVADEKSKHGITKKLQLFVVSLAGGPLVRVGTMSKRLSEQLDVLEGVSEFYFEVVYGTHKWKKVGF